MTLGDESTRSAVAMLEFDGGGDEVVSGEDCLREGSGVLG